MIIPDTVTKIGEAAFKDCGLFRGKLIIPGSVKRISNYAFEDCTGFEELVLSEGLTHIGKSAFADTRFTGDLVIPDGVEEIGEAAFEYSDDFTGTLVIPNSVVRIETNAFAYCGFTNIVVSFNENLKTGYSIFWDCKDVRIVKYMYKPYILSEVIGCFKTNAVIHYPTYVDGWEEEITKYPEKKFVAYEPAVVPFVQRMYEVALDRTADEGGLKSWVGELLSGNKTGAEVAFDFIFSNEFKEKNYCDEHYVMQLYKAFMGREYDEGGLNHWLGMMKSGTTREAVFNGFSQSNEFKEICESYGLELGAPIDKPLNGTVPTGPCVVDGKENGVVSFIKRLYKICLDREADENGLSYWNGMLRRNECSGATAAHGFIFSPEFVNKNHSDADFVEYLYQAFMGRASEPNGKAYWLERMASGEVTREDVFNGFAYSGEFVEICNGYGIVAY